MASVVAASRVKTSEQVSFDDDDLKPEPVSVEQLGNLGALIDEAVKAQATVTELETKLKEANLALTNLTDVRIPTLMGELKLATFTTTDGVVVKVKEDIRANPGGAKDPDRFAKVCQWLTENGHGGIIKHEVAMMFGTGEKESCDRVLEALDPIAKELGKEVADTMNIHTQTFASFCREQLEQGAELPDYFNIFRQTVAKIALPAASKK